MYQGSPTGAPPQVGGWDYVNAAAQIGTSIYNNESTKAQNRKAEAFNREMWEKQGVRELEYYHMQNAYNDPHAQMQRLKNAKLNPNLVYGNGATTESATAKAGGAPSAPNYRVPTLDAGSVVQSALQNQLLRANISRTEAETRSIDARTIGTTFENDLNKLIGIDAKMENFMWASNQIAIKSEKANAEWETYKASHYDGHTYDSPNSPIAKAHKAGFKKAEEELKNAKALGDIRRAETVIKQFESNLTKMGLPANSPWHIKILGDLYNQIKDKIPQLK